MRDFQYTGGLDINNISNKEFMRFETAKAKEIVIALDKSGVPFSARYGDSEMVLTYDGSYKEQVECIITKANSGEYEAMLRELQTYGMPDGYYRLLGEVAEMLNTTVGTLQARPDEVQLALCKTYADFWLCDTATIQRELDRIITVNGRTLSDIQEYEKSKVVLCQENGQVKENKLAKLTKMQPHLFHGLLTMSLREYGNQAAAAASAYRQELPGSQPTIFSLIVNSFRGINACNYGL